MKHPDSVYVLQLDPVHRALIELVAERHTDPIAIRNLEGFNIEELGRQLADFMRFELIRIPKGSAAAPCFWCHEPVYVITGRHKKGSAEKVSIAGAHCAAPTADTWGHGFLHLANCPKSGLLTYKLRAGGRASPLEADLPLDEDDGGVAT